MPAKPSTTSEPAETGLTLRQILIANQRAGTPLTHAGPQQVRKVTTGRWKVPGFGAKARALNGFEFLMQDSGKSSSGFAPPRRHKCWVMIRDEGDQQKPVSAKNTRLVVGCSCEFWMYYCEYALAKRWKASWIRMSNGQPPNTTNPRLVPLTCKHLHVALTHCLRQGI